MTPIKVRSAVVPINDLKPYPLNPRRGNVRAIQESLKFNGQYRPIVVQADTNLILAGNHTWLAAKNLGWTEIAVSFVDCDEKSAKKIVLADNRTTDLGSFDDTSLRELLDELESWEGTGYTRDQFDEIDGLYKEPLPSPKPTEDEEKPQVAPPQENNENLVRIGIYVFDAEEDELNALSLYLKNLSKAKKEQVEMLKELLCFDVIKGNQTEPLVPHPVVISGTEVVAINRVAPHERNPREGDVGAISESLKVLGQYRPIVADINTKRILVGNHTWQAAVALGWTEISVTWVEVDEEQAVRILLADNKTADLATYEEQDLQVLLSSLSEFSGTGFDADDVDSILRGGEATPLPKKLKCVVGPYSFRVARTDYQAWQNDLPLAYEDACALIAERLRLTNWTIRKAEE